MRSCDHAPGASDRWRCSRVWRRPAWFPKRAPPLLYRTFDSHVIAAYSNRNAPAVFVRYRYIDDTQHTMRDRTIEAPYLAPIRTLVSLSTTHRSDHGQEPNLARHVALVDVNTSLFGSGPGRVWP